MFSYTNSIINLLKKSMPGIGIDKKKVIFDSLDAIQRDSGEEKAMRKEFERLTKATVEACHGMGQDEILFDVERILLEVDGNDVVLKVINEFLAENEIIN